MKSSHCWTDTDKGLSCSMSWAAPQCRRRKIFCKGWILGASSKRFFPWSLDCFASSSNLRIKRNPFLDISKHWLLFNQRSALYMVRTQVLIAMVACRQSSNSGWSGNDLSINWASKKSIITLDSSPLCQIPHGKFPVVCQPIVSLVSFWMWAL